MSKSIHTSIIVHVNVAVISMFLIHGNLIMEYKYVIPHTQNYLFEEVSSIVTSALLKQMPVSNCYPKDYEQIMIYSAVDTYV